jgi:geranylgeranyl diphosphate synthase type II
LNAEALLRDKSARTEEALRALVAEWKDAPPRLVEAVSYSLFAGGKRLRPALALGACEMVCGTDDPALPVACALEMVHTYSLIHDDLPAMDDDDLRRGRPTSHKVFGEATAILAGDALLTLAFEAAARNGSAVIVTELARAAGVAGMVGGQQMDMDAEGRDVTLAELRGIHACKTGALIRSAARCGALAGGADAAQLDALSAYGDSLGLAFQIADDLLDVTGDAEKLGKATGADAAHVKATYPSLLGLEEARRLARQTIENALDALAPFGPEADAFRALAHFVIDRDR